MANTVSLVEGVAGLAKGVGMPKGANPVRGGASMAEGAEGVAGSRPSLAGEANSVSVPNRANPVKGAGLVEGPEAVAAREAAHAQEVLAQVREVNKINKGVPLRNQKNCISCAIAADKTLGGNPTFAENGGSHYIGEVLKSYPGRQFVQVRGVSGYWEVSKMMQEAGPGSRGIAFANRSPAVGHVINVVNHEGTVVFVCAQSVRVDYYPSYKSLYLLRTN